ncbi:unnamed protein product [Darwinula stevensoni]|uniref:Uncharacterized protein n=1 Tax=Darwinula stevensoni TaxID=69355 RepID=A0A7R8WZL5_9CRUS|nr:unnamed protein product [Darwinula stevensoni]CAG0880269.1 unnamed protein product [Darwinula stevensoni]
MQKPEDKEGRGKKEDGRSDGKLAPQNGLLIGLTLMVPSALVLIGMFVYVKRKTRTLPLPCSETIRPSQLPGRNLSATEEVEEGKLPEERDAPYNPGYVPLLNESTVHSQNESAFSTSQFPSLNIVKEKTQGACVVQPDQINYFFQEKYTIFEGPFNIPLSFFYSLVGSVNTRWEEIEDQREKRSLHEVISYTIGKSAFFPYCSLGFNY